MGRLTTRHSQFLQQQLNWTVSDALGATITPGTSNAKGSWVDLFGGVVTDDTYGIWLAFHNSTGTHNDILADIGVDPAGGTSYSVLIPNLIASYAASFVQSEPLMWGHSYYFPLYIKAGSRVACRAQTVLGTAIAVCLRSRLMQKPTHPELVKCGDFVDTVGIDTANSRGTVIASGARTGGSWGLLGTAPRDAFYFEKGCSISSSGSMQSSNNIVDFGIGSPQRTLIQQMRLGAAPALVAEEFVPSRWRYATIPAGVSLYARNESDSSSPDTFYAAMYLVGGFGRS